MNNETQLKDLALSIRSLSMDAIQKANSGHPGLPLGCAEIGASLFGDFLKYSNKNPQWVNRDRFVLSAGHGSMFLYSLLCLFDRGVSLDDIKSFRQKGSITPGHPEVFETKGVEMTTGPLGQGLATAVGMALSAKILADKFNTDEHKVFDHTVYTLAGDGCIMEGISHEASSFAGHYALDNLVVLYDSNDISLDGDLEDCFSEDVAKRYEAYGFDTIQIDGHSFEALTKALEFAKNKNSKPKLIVCKTTIGKGSPSKEGTSSVHGSPLGDSEIEATRLNLGLQKDQSFYMGEQGLSYAKATNDKMNSLYDEWSNTFDGWKNKNPELYEEYLKMQSLNLDELEAKMPTFKVGDTLAGRKSSQECLQVLGENLPSLLGGSADLSCSDATLLKAKSIVTKQNYNGANIKYGVREFAMGAIANGLALSGFFHPYVGTFLNFSDYIRPAIRLTALVGLNVNYQFTHDSIFLGEDGPTHQPVEHAAALRAIPNTQVFRPADGNETKASWLCALKHQGPSCFLLSRQNLPHLSETQKSVADGVSKGAYKVFDNHKDVVDFVFYSSGSELSLTLEVAKKADEKGLGVCVYSVPCFELFEEQTTDYKNDVLCKQAKNRVAIEAQVSMGWHRFVGYDGEIISVDKFGMSAPLKEIQEAYGFTVDQICNRLFN
ncbi:MAG: transketolase [Candidatus Cloacimonadota bacterium]|nr:MAG: transketolase [Candidatus Cloacimonadota bacterium]